jgi:N6-L-threonylcarbamoyladenine synthase
MLILGIETSCDETAAAVVRDGRKILSNVIASQVDIHSRYGGIVPEVASRQHLLTIIPIITEAMCQAAVRWSGLDAIAFTHGPGLAGSLLVGVNIAKAIALSHNLPLIGINHLEGHIYANWLEGEPPDFPALCLIVSGGHSDLLLMHGHGEYQPLGRTRDDAAGEAFDKVARILDLGYPGGPAIEKAARKGSSIHHLLPRAWLKGTDDFSFSGLKTAVLRLVAGTDGMAQPQRGRTDGKFEIVDIAASFQEAVVDVLVTKTVSASSRLGARNILLCGGVAANNALRVELAKRSPIPTIIPSPVLCTDNAAMIAACAHFHLALGERSNWQLDVIPNLKLS